ncbi:ferredoxin [Kitasatospora sp. NBC_01302]|uniref:ferredoxin n=1 Tax=Kitasatospora sp. NBC_01302 TaxID=2903575 RepID=UPI002E13B08A|nr:ferredoxin [Kitasatospora sp. NBC_01302]
MRISVDHDHCIGSGMCEVTAPKVFTLNDDGYAEIIAGAQDGAGDPMVKEAVRGCPVQAIKIGE